MRELNFDTGVVEYRVNGGTVIRFNPADTGFVERLHDLFEKLGREQEALKADEGVFDQIRSREAQMRADIDGVFGPGTCQAVFAGVGVYALAGGLPLWANFLLAVLDEVADAIGQQQKAASPRVEKYMEKYAAWQNR